MLTAVTFQAWFTGFMVSQSMEGQERHDHQGARSSSRFGLYLLDRRRARASCSGSNGKNEEFTPTDEFKLDPWVSLEFGPVDMSINKAVLYLVLACVLTARW